MESEYEQIRFGIFSRFKFGNDPTKINADFTDAYGEYVFPITIAQFADVFVRNV